MSTTNPLVVDEDIESANACDAGRSYAMSASVNIISCAISADCEATYQPLDSNCNQIANVRIANALRWIDTVEAARLAFSAKL